MARDRFYFITLNFIKEKHKDLIEWVKREADDREMSLSSFCISILKKYKADMEEKDEKTDY